MLRDRCAHPEATVFNADPSIAFDTCVLVTVRLQGVDTSTWPCVKYFCGRTLKGVLSSQISLP